MSADPTKKLQSLLRKLKSQHQGLEVPGVLPETPDAFEPLVHQLVFSLLVWEASTSQARSAMRRLRDAFVDYNELRICVPDEIAASLGEKYPLSHERAMRLRSVLNDLFRKQHCISLKHLIEAPKREARNYLESLEGIPAYAASRTCVVGGLGHAVPVDERLRDLLAGESVVEDGNSPASAGAWIERHVRAEDGLETHLLLQAWSDENGHPPKKERRHAITPVAPGNPDPGRSKAQPKARPATSKAETGSSRKGPKAKPRSGS